MKRNLNNLKKFTRKTTEKLDNYVYALVDPHNNEIFYIGRGSGNVRPFAHLSTSDKDNNEAKKERIAAIRSQGNKPQIEIIRYGLDCKTACEVEAAVIDAIGIENLTNSIHGNGKERGRATAKEIEEQLGGDPIDIDHIDVRAILLYPHHAYKRRDNLYDGTRQFWNINSKKVQKKINGEFLYKYAFAMKGSFIREIYKILAWYPAGTTVSSREFKADGKRRWEFIGSLAEDKVRKKYLHKVIHKNGGLLHAPQRGIRYL